MPRKPYHVRPRIRKILEDRRHFGDDPPNWFEGKNNRPCRSARDAEAERWRLIKRLRRYAAKSSNTDAYRLIDRLEGCHPQTRCGSGACAECSRAMQRWFVTAISQLIAEAEGGEDN